MGPSRIIPTAERAECSICRRPVDLLRTARTAAFFEPGDRTRPHRCPEEALIRFRQMLRMARLGGPTANKDLGKSNGENK